MLDGCTVLRAESNLIHGGILHKASLYMQNALIVKHRLLLCYARSLSPVLSLNGRGCGLRQNPVDRNAWLEYADTQACKERERINSSCSQTIVHLNPVVNACGKLLSSPSSDDAK